MQVVTIVIDSDNSEGDEPAKQACCDLPALVYDLSCFKFTPRCADTSLLLDNFTEHQA